MSRYDHLSYDTYDTYDTRPDPGPTTPRDWASPGTATPAHWSDPTPVPNRGNGSRNAGRAALTALAVVALSMGGGYAGARFADPGPATTAPPAVLATPASTGDAVNVAHVLDTMQGSVVSIHSTVTLRQGRFASTAQGAGTGVVIDDNGLVLTNAHVVDGANAVTVRLQGDTSGRRARVLAASPSNDLALLQVTDTDGMRAATFADAGTLRVGESVIAIGNALDLEGDMTVTRGIVSALGRTVSLESGVIAGMIQTDAAISSGNSGGPLVNAAGQVVGITTAVAASSGARQASNVGFAIPVDRALEVVARMNQTLS
jgi:S1-C subfamily serine protease